MTTGRITSNHRRPDGGTSTSGHRVPGFGVGPGRLWGTAPGRLLNYTEWKASRKTSSRYAHVILDDQKGDGRLRNDLR